MKLHLVLVLKRQDHYPCLTLLMAVILFLVSLGKGRDCMDHVDGL